MKRSELEKCLGKQVNITLFNGHVLSGELHKTGQEECKHDANLYYPKNYYYVGDPQHSAAIRLIFRCSHIKKLKEERKNENK